MPRRKSSIKSAKEEEETTTTTTSTTSTPSKKQKVTPKYKYAIEAKDLGFSYGTLTSSGIPVFSNVSLKLVPGGRCVLIGANGTGKTTLLRLLSGKHLPTEGTVEVLGKSAFYQTPLGVTFLGHYTRNKLTAGVIDPWESDIVVSNLLASCGGDDYPERRDKLIHIMDVDVNSHLHVLSDGTRRRVQIVAALLKPFELLLLDEVTVDLDCIVRDELLKFLREETEQRNAAIIYATHIFDGLSDWPTHFAHMSFDGLDRIYTREELTIFDEKQASTNTNESRLLQLAKMWLKDDLKKKREKEAKNPKQKDEEREDPAISKSSYFSKTDKFYK